MGRTNLQIALVGAAQALSFLTSLLLAKLFGAAVFGDYSTHIAWVSLLQGLVLLRGDQLVLVERDAAVRDAVYRRLLRVAIILFGIGAMGVVALHVAPDGAVWERSREMSWVFACAVLLATNAMCCSKEVNSGHYILVSWLRLLQAVLFPLLCLTIEGDWLAGKLLLAYASSFLAPTVIILILQLRQAAPAAPPRDIDSRKLWRFAGIYMINSAAVASVPVAFSLVASSEVFGNLALALRMCLVPVSFANLVFAPMLLSAFVQRTRDASPSDDRFRVFMRGVNARLTIAACVVAATMLSASQWLGWLYAGSEWSFAPLYLAILCPLTIIQLFVSPKVDFLFVVGKEAGVLWFDVFRIVLSAIVALVIGLVSEPALVLCAYALVAVALFYWLSGRVADVIARPFAATAPPVNLQ